MAIKKYVCFILSMMLIFSACSRNPKAPSADNGNSSTHIAADDSVKKNDEQPVDKTVNTPSDQQPLEKNANNNADNSTDKETVNPETEKTGTYSNKTIGWYFVANKNHATPGAPNGAAELLKKYSGYYVGDTSSKVLYLTFDEGYENGYSKKILEILKDNDVKAAFFVTKPYINQNKELIKRMVDEGHIVANHTSTHPSMPTKTGNPDAFKKEFEDTEKAFTDVTGKEMPKFFRPPMGEFSEKSLKMTHDLGYKTIFWSFAHRDWLVDDQPGVKAAHDKVINGVHNGAILLLHAVSKSNTEALDSIIKDLKAQGYTFSSLDEL